VGKSDSKKNKRKVGEKIVGTLCAKNNEGIATDREGRGKKKSQWTKKQKKKGDPDACKGKEKREMQLSYTIEVKQTRGVGKKRHQKAKGEKRGRKESSWRQKVMILPQARDWRRKKAASTWLGKK